MRSKKPKHRVYDPYGPEAMFEEFGNQAMTRLYEALEQRKQRWAEKASDLEEIRENLGLLMGAPEQKERFQKLERRFYGKHKSLPLLFRAAGLWTLWHEGALIAVWPDRLLP